MQFKSAAKWKHHTNRYCHFCHWEEIFFWQSDNEEFPTNDVDIRLCHRSAYAALTKIWLTKRVYVVLLFIFSYLNQHWIRRLKLLLQWKKNKLVTNVSKLHSSPFYVIKKSTIMLKFSNVTFLASENISKKRISYTQLDWRSKHILLDGWPQATRTPEWRTIEIITAKRVFTWTSPEIENWSGYSCSFRFYFNDGNREVLKNQQSLNVPWLHPLIDNILATHVNRAFDNTKLVQTTT